MQIFFTKIDTIFPKYLLRIFDKNFINEMLKAYLYYI